MVVNYLANQHDRVHFAAGDVIFREGDAGELMYSVLEGTLEVTLEGQVLEVIHEGSVIGEMVLLGEKTRSATATAVTNVTLVPVKRHQFLWLIHETPTFATQIMEIMADRLKRMNRMLT